MTKSRNKRVQSQDYHLTLEESFRQGGGWIIILLFAPIFLITTWDIALRDPNYIRGLLASHDSWSMTTGRITNSFLERQVYGIKTGNTVTAKVSYEFKINGKLYRGHRISFASPVVKEKSTPIVENIIKKYPIGREVNVFYFSTNPTNCVLEPQKKSYSQILLPLGLNIVSLISIVLGIRGTYKYRWLPRYSK